MNSGEDVPGARWHLRLDAQMCSHNDSQKSAKEIC